MRQDYDNGKYTVIFNERTGAMHALRNGEAWQDMSGNKLVYWMLVEHKRALERIAELEKDADKNKVDAECFRWWVHEAAANPSLVAKAISHCITEDEYRDVICGAIEAKNAVINTAMQKD